jgi:hypothetical protein
MSLKYYKDERARYGQMGSVTEEQAKAVLELCYTEFDMPRLKFKVNPRKKKRSVYRVGAMMLSVCGRVAKPLEVPAIDMAPTMMTWLTLLHEFAHHMHTVQFHRKGMALAEQLGKPMKDRLDRQTFTKTFLRRQHGHGHEHRVLVQTLVDHFVRNGMITELPTYMTVNKRLYEGEYRTEAEILGMQVAAADALTRQAA